MYQAIDNDTITVGALGVRFLVRLSHKGFCPAPFTQFRYAAELH